MSALSLVSVVPWLSWIATDTLNTPLAASMADPAAGCAVKTSLGAPAVGTWSETPDAVVHSPPLSELPPAKKANTDPATRPSTTIGTAIRSTRFFL